MQTDKGIWFALSRVLMSAPFEMSNRPICTILVVRYSVGPAIADGGTYADVTFRGCVVPADGGWQVRFGLPRLTQADREEERRTELLHRGCWLQ